MGTKKWQKLNKKSFAPFLPSFPDLQLIFFLHGMVGQSLVPSWREGGGRYAAVFLRRRSFDAKKRTKGLWKRRFLCERSLPFGLDHKKRGVFSPFFIFKSRGLLYSAWLFLFTPKKWKHTPEKKSHSAGNHAEQKLWMKWNSKKKKDEKILLLMVISLFWFFPWLSPPADTRSQRTREKKGDVEGESSKFREKKKKATFFHLRQL